MKRISLATIAVVVLALAFVPSQQVPAQARTQDPSAAIEAFLREKMQKRHIPGLQVAVVRHGKIVMLGAYGTANLQDDVPVTDQTVFSVNSATKPFTGVAIMQLVEDGKVDLAAPASRYIEGLPVAWQAVTVRQLLTHTSGFPDILVPPKGQGTGSLVGDGGEESAWTTVRTLPMDFAPGEKYRYNQTNYVLLGKIIDKLSGEPFAQFMADRQFKAARMASAVFGDGRDIIAHRAQAYRYAGGTLTAASSGGKLEQTYDEFTPFIRTAGGLNASAQDLARWIIALQDGTLLKQKSSLATLWTPAKFNNGLPTPWALGWPTISRPEHRAVAGIGGRRSAFFVYPADDMAVVILTNLAGANPEEFIDEVAGHYIPDLLAINGGGLPAAIKLIHKEVLKRGYAQAPAVVEELKKKDSDFNASENDLNNWGGRLMVDGQLKEAIEIFKLNVTLYPQSANTYDSLGEAYELDGDKAQAIRNYRRSLELDPKNNNAVEHLKTLEPAGAGPSK